MKTLTKIRLWFWLLKLIFAPADAFLWLTLVNARSNVARLTVVDLAHSAGALPVDVVANEIDFAVGCTYKYFNAGPGAPAFLYAAERHLKQQRQPLHPLYGWLRARSAICIRGPLTHPADGIRQFLTGTPPVLSLVAVDAALDLFC